MSLKRPVHDRRCVSWLPRVLGILVVLLAGVGQTPPTYSAQRSNHYANTWSTLHRDSRNSDYMPVATVGHYRVRWHALDGAAVIVGPIIGPQGNIYVTTGQGAGTSNLHALSPHGDLLWESAPQKSRADLDYGAVINAPIIDTQGHIYVADSNQLWSYTSKGQVRWVADLRKAGAHGYFVTPLFSKQGYVGGITSDGKIMFFDRDDGHPVWPTMTLPEAKTPASKPPPPGLWRGGLMAHDFIRPLWDLIYGRDATVTNTPAVDPATGRIFITAAGASTDAGVLYGIDTPSSGPHIAFAAPMGGGSGTSPAISPDGNLVYAIDGNGVMVAIDTHSGKRRWAARNTMGQASPSVGPDGTVYTFNGTKGMVIAIGGKTGKVRWRRQFDPIARKYLDARQGSRRVTTVDGLITVTQKKLWVFLDLSYQLKIGKLASFPAPKHVLLATLDPGDGTVITTTGVRDTSGAFAVPAGNGDIYVSMSAAASSIAYYGLRRALPGFARWPSAPEAGIQALHPTQDAMRDHKSNGVSKGARR